MNWNDYYIEVFNARDDDWRWRLKHTNGNVVAATGEGYINHTHAVRMAVRLFPEVEDIREV